MTNESGIQVENAPNTPDIQLQETTKPQKYTAEEFYADLKKIQDQAEQEPTPEPEPEPQLEEAPAAHEIELPAEVDEEEEEIFKGPIPKKRLNKEIEKRKAIEQELMLERENRIKYETELNLYNKALEQLQAKNNANPEVEIEPIDNDAHNLYMKKIAELEKKLEAQSQNFTYNQAQMQAQNILTQQEAKFVQKHPDYKDAIDYIVKTEINNYSMTGLSQQDAEKVTKERILGIAAKALELGKDVPEIMYNLARNYGYNAQKTTKTGPNLANIEKNIKKSETILNDVPEIATTFAPEGSSYTNLEGFQRLMNSNGRGVNANEFHKILAKVREGR